MAIADLRLPSYRLHKPSGQAVVTLCGRDDYLGRYGTPTSQAEYDRLAAEWLAHGRSVPCASVGTEPDVSVNEVMLAFFGWAEGYHRKNGKLTSEVPHIRYSIKPVRELYGDTPARAFGPLQFKTVRQSIIKTEICRNEVNRRIRIIVRGFKWAVSEGMIPASVHHGLQTVTGLRRGRSEVRESEPVRPVPDAFVDAIRPHVSRQIWAMVQIQRLTGMRPGEICSLRTVDIDRSSKVWVFDTPR